MEVSETSGKRPLAKEKLMLIGLVTTALQGGGMIWGFSAFADVLVSLPGSPYDSNNVSSIFTIGNNLNAWGCIFSGLILDAYGPRVCAVTGLLMEAGAHVLLAKATTYPAWITYGAFGLLGIGGSQVLIAALAFVDAFKSPNFMSSILTAAFQAGAVVFMVLPFVDWRGFFYFYAVFCIVSAVLCGVYPDAPLPAYSQDESCGSSGSFPLLRDEDMGAAKSKMLDRMRECLEPCYSLNLRTVWFLLTFMVAGSAFIYGEAEFVSALASKDRCGWNSTTTTEICEHQGLQDDLNDRWMPFVGNFVIPCALAYGKLIDRTGFAIPAFINIASVQLFLLALWLLPLPAQYLTLLVFNVANTSVWTMQNAYVCAAGTEHMGFLYGLSNLVLGLGNLLSDYLALDPFGEDSEKGRVSLAVSCSAWIICCMPLYYWVFVEHRHQKDLQNG